MKLMPSGSKKQQEGNRTARGQEAGHQEESAPVGHAVVGQENLDISIEHGSQVIPDPQCDRVSRL